MWHIDLSRIENKIKNFKSNKQLLTSYKSFLEDVKLLKDTDNPSKLGNRKNGRYRDCFGYCLTNSYRLIFSINYDEHTIIFVTIGDHKEVYGKDNKS